MREPAFWWREESRAAALLAPLASLYGAVAAWRLRRRGAEAGIPVLCVGNFTTGGAGKTPAVGALGAWLEAAGARPFVLSRGYGGRLRGPLRVDRTLHTAQEVGDEPLLLARSLPTVVARDRVAGAALARSAGAGVIVMDDGFQNPSLRKDCALLVVDGRGVGNGRVIPAGPLRAPLDAQLGRMDALLVVGSAPERILAAAGASPVWRGTLVPDDAAVARLRGQRLLAFAGIGDPEKFFATLAGAGLEVVERRAFPDHHVYTAAEAAGLVEMAKSGRMMPVTTEKDQARMHGIPHLAELARQSAALPVSLVVEDAAGLQQLIRRKLGLP
jgi:tetraacyldisaccharide 4'-kinase